MSPGGEAAVSLRTRQKPESRRSRRGRGRDGLKGKQVEGGDGRGAPCTAGRDGGGEGLVVGLDGGEGPMEGECKV